MSGCEYDVGSGDVLSLAASSSCTAYDAEFVVLARALGVPLVTTDKELLENFPATAVDPARGSPGPDVPAEAGLTRTYRLNL